MSSDVFCKLCEAKVKIDQENSSSRSSSGWQKVLINHFSLDHNIKTSSKETVNYLLLMHDNQATKMNSKKRKRSLSQNNLSTSTPMKVSSRTPLKEKSLNITNDVTPKGIVKPWVTVQDQDIENQLELFSSPPPPICVISSVASAEALSTSILDEHDSSDFELTQENDVVQEEIDVVDNPIVDTLVDEKKDETEDVKEDEKNVSVSSLDNSWLSDDNYEVIHRRRLMNTAENGRYVCPAPEPECSFKCESKVLLSIHVRKKHNEMFGSPFRKQKMMIYLDPVIVDREVEVETDDTDIEHEEERPDVEDRKFVKLTFVKDKDIVHHIHNIVRGTKRSKPDTEQETVERPAKKIKVEKPSPVATPTEQKPTVTVKKEILKNLVRRIKEEAPEESSDCKSDRERTIEKMRFLQSGRSYGTYVQCSLESCGKWRYLEGCEDPSMVPDTWQCSMNPNILSNACHKGVSEQFVEGNEEFVDTEYAAGSMVWAKMKGYPWWPALVDFCPDTDEYYWLDSWNEEVSQNNILDTYINSIL